MLDVHQCVPHQLKQKLVYISNSTEIGTFTPKRTGKFIKILQKKKSIFIYGWSQIRTRFNGKSNDVTWEDVAKIYRCFYLREPKTELLLGEAIIINRQSLTRRIRVSS